MRSAGWGLLNLLVVASTLLLADTESPLFHDHTISYDSDIFALAGRIWADGGLPYVDYWDHKGPLIFLANAVGYVLTGSTVGVLIVDAILITVTMLFLWLVIDELAERTLHIAVRVLILWTLLPWLSELLIPSWNMCETVCLPFLAAALWLAVCDMKAIGDGRTDRIAPATALAQGIACGASLMTRATNAIGVCVLTLTMVIWLVANRRWANLAHCALAFIGGMLLLYAPFAIYFAARGAFDDFMYGTLIYNLGHISNAPTRLVTSGKIYDMALILGVPMLMILVPLLRILRRQRDLLTLSMMAAGITLTVFFAVSEPYKHYVVIAVPFLPVLMVWCCELVRRPIVYTTVLTLVFGLLSAYAVIEHRHLMGWPTYDNPAVERVVRESHGSVAFYGLPAVVYERYDVTPAYPLANLQDWQALFSDGYKAWLRDMYATPRTEYLIVNPTAALDEPVIQPELDAHYDLVETTEDGLDIYRAR
ncbi:hypothetical protein [Bifidobacterium samirii]|uniref:hypothetical protein n=1 Tax=Bifidobacterium samirii TaxID=2306974 RepID=UPI000F7F273B|nr:hypothetical protein [Bifidobacterium samirii]